MGYEEFTVRQTLELASRLYGQWDSTLAHTLAGRFKLPPSQRVGRLSKGTKVKLGLVAALAHRADLLILDEPTAGLDPTARADLQDTVNEQHGVLIVENGGVASFGPNAYSTPLPASGSLIFKGLIVGSKAELDTPDPVVIQGSAASDTLEIAGLLKTPRLFLSSVEDLDVNGGELITSELFGDSVLLRSGAQLSHVVSTTSSEPSLEIQLTDLEIDATSAIDVTGRGYVGGFAGGNGNRAGRRIFNQLGSTYGDGGSLAGQPLRAGSALAERGSSGRLRGPP